MTTANVHTHAHTYKVRHTQNGNADSDEGLQVYFYMERNEIQVNTAGRKMQAAHTHTFNKYDDGICKRKRVRGE